MYIITKLRWLGSRCFILVDQGSLSALVHITSVWMMPFGWIFALHLNVIIPIAIITLCCLFNSQSMLLMAPWLSNLINPHLLQLKNMHLLPFSHGPLITFNIVWKNVILITNITLFEHINFLKFSLFHYPLYFVSIG